MVEIKHLTEPTTDAQGKRFATLSWIAREINRKFPPKGRWRPVSRQFLHKSWKNRERTRFPSSANSTGGGGGRPVFDVDAVIGWYVDRRHYRIGTVTPPSDINEHQDDGGGSTLAA